MLDGEWESWITRVFLDVVRPGMTVVDIGAKVGYYTLLAARAVGEQGKVIAFEPEPTNFRLMEKSVEINGFKERVRLSPAAVSDARGKASLRIARDCHGAGHSLFAGMVADPREQVSVDTVPLDEFLDAGTRVDVMKLDAEGAEPLIFAGMSRVMADNPDILLIMEFAPNHFRKSGQDPKAFLDEIRKTGFPLRHISETGVVEPLSEEQVLEPGYKTLFLQRGR
jgi:FkbM family methyltransferase